MTVQYEDPEYLEAVFASLFSLLSTAALPDGIVLQTKARVVVPPDQIPTADQPALVLVQGPMHGEQREIFGPTKWIFTAVAVIYLRADTAATNTGTTTPPSPLPITTANRIVWALATALGQGTTPGGVPEPYQRQELGGLVYHAWIEGEIMSEVVSEQMVITIPINILPGPMAP